MREGHILAIDQGTTSSRAMIFDQSGHCVARAQQEFRQIYPRDGWVEHDPEEIWKSVLAVCRDALQQAERIGIQVIGIGITTQRETTIIWERKTGKPLYNAIVWQDRRTAEYCAELKRSGHEAKVAKKTGLLLDPYFSGTKLNWILGHVEGARAKAEKGDLAFGTIDSFLLWRLTGGKVHATDATNASRTLLFNIHEQKWDESLLELFNIPAALLPEVKDCVADYGTTDARVFGRAIPIGGIAGDQQAAAIGQACIEPGMIKSTYGTGCFVLMNTGEKAFRSQNRLLTTVAYRIAGKTSYAIEGSIFVAGAAIQWLRDGLELIGSAGEVEGLAQGLESNRGVYLVPAFTGLGAPHWDPDARGAIFGLTRDTGIAEIARATLESVGYQTYDLMEAMKRDSQTGSLSLRVDGGMVTNNWFLQFLANILDISVERPRVIETTALGAAYLAGVQFGLFTSLADIKKHWQGDALFTPRLAPSARKELLRGWEKAISRVLEAEN
ncbi:glycerol kinase GlpK [Geopsychrobacter electrodiphilus]|uniref:glycerol kinase GlpK n=1 Tax=Geopsychrobacter electrodiphilus TaxID=225196 RepID=UPI00037D68BA|nr:glycerol kinase GlpK [Geopsychrobacter electrodiphilus]